MPAGSEGTLIGWYAGDEWVALVNFWDGGPLRVPTGLVEKVDTEVGVADTLTGAHPGAAKPFPQRRGGLR